VKDLVRFEFAPRPKKENKGWEGIAYNKEKRAFYVCQEKSPMQVLTFSRPPKDKSASWRNGSLKVTEPFSAEKMLGKYIDDISGCFFHPKTGRLLILSEESARILDVTVDGKVVGTFDLPEDYQFEGLTMNKAYDLIVTSEPNYLKTYKRKKTE
jgi:uncharacterized protein YjiK